MFLSPVHRCKRDRTLFTIYYIVNKFIKQIIRFGFTPANDAILIYINIPSGPGLNLTPVDETTQTSQLRHTK
jgi:hypothetical protein